MECTLREALLKRGWQSQWFNETETIARIDSHYGLQSFVPFFFKHRLFAKDRYIPLRSLLGDSQIRILFSDTLARDADFLGLIETGGSAEFKSKKFPWSSFLQMEWPGFPRSRLNPLSYHYFVTDPDNGERWQMATITLTWIRDIVVRLPD